MTLEAVQISSVRIVLARCQSCRVDQCSAVGFASLELSVGECLVTVQRISVRQIPVPNFAAG